MALNLIYALKNNELKHISEVESGKACNCVCPGCGSVLIAKKGKKVIHHFAHYNGDLCKYGYETSLHMAAKRIISEAKKFTVPPIYDKFPISDKVIKRTNSIEISVDSVELEKYMGDIIPDIIIYSGNKKIMVEIFVSHAIDEEKEKKIKEHNISTIEIDLSNKKDIISEEELREILLNNSDLKRWVYNSTTNSIVQKFLQKADYKLKKHKIYDQGSTIHIGNCPKEARLWKGSPYAVYRADCLDCIFYLSETEDGIYCSGRLGYAEIEDFELTEHQRKLKYNLYKKDRKTKISEGMCPDCGHNIVFRQGKNGVFCGCTNYPKCRWTANIDQETGEIQ